MFAWVRLLAPTLLTASGGRNQTVRQRHACGDGSSVLLAVEGLQLRQAVRKIDLPIDLGLIEVLLTGIGMGNGTVGDFRIDGRAFPRRRQSFRATTPSHACV